MLHREDLLVLSMHNEMSSAHFSTLTLLYKPLIGDQAYNLYLTLVAIKQQELQISNHSLIERTTKLSMEAMEQARAICEQFLLVRTFYNKQENKYLYALGVPMQPSAFLGHDVFGRYFQKVMGSDALAFYNKNERIVDKTNYIEMSSQIENLIKDKWNEVDEKTFNETQKDFDQTKFEHLNIIFNEQEFLHNLGELVLPSSQRTAKTIREIAEIATIYGVNESMMRKLLVRAWDDDTHRVDMAKLTDVCLKTTAKYSNTFKDAYMLPTIRFLEEKQNGVKLGYADKLLAIKLVEEYKLQPQVANIIFDTCLKMNNQKIVGTVIERLASSWLRLKIDNLEMAKKQMLVEINSFQQNKFNKQNIIVQDWDDIQQPSNDDDEELLEQFNKLKEEYNATNKI